MTKKYTVRHPITDYQEEITREISRDTYDSLKSGNPALLDALYIEERYEFVLLNFLAWEKGILTVTADNMIRQDINYIRFHETRRVLSLQMINFLTTARMYVDQVPGLCKSCVPPGTDSVKIFKGYTTREHNKNSHYRFMDALRNFVQHYSDPVHWASYGTAWTSLDEDGQMEFRVDLASLRESLVADGRMKKSVLDEIGDKVDLPIACRSYVESISAIHQDVRELIGDYVEAQFERVLEVCREAFGELEKRPRAIVLENWEGNIRTESVDVILDWWEMRERLVRCNPKLSNLHKRYVSSVAKRAKVR